MGAAKAFLLWSELSASPVAQWVENLPAVQETPEARVQSLGQEAPWRRAGQPTPVLLPGEFHGQRSLVGYSPWGLKGSDTTEQLIFSFTFCSVKHFAGMLQMRLVMPLNLLASLLECTAPCSVIRRFGGPGEVGSLLLVRGALTFPEPTAQCGAAPACEHQRHLCRSFLWVRGL